MPTGQLERVFVEALGLPPGTDVRSLTYRSIPQWDSVAHMNLVREIEATWDIMMDSEDVLDLSSYPKAVEILRKYDVELG
jgi:acyl carrier protein